MSGAEHFSNFYTTYAIFLAPPSISEILHTDSMCHIENLKEKLVHRPFMFHEIMSITSLAFGIAIILIIFFTSTEQNGTEKF